MNIIKSLYKRFKPDQPAPICESVHVGAGYYIPYCVKQHHADRWYRYNGNYEFTHCPFCGKLSVYQGRMISSK